MNCNCELLMGKTATAEDEHTGVIVGCFFDGVYLKLVLQLEDGTLDAHELSCVKIDTSQSKAKRAR